MDKVTFDGVEYVKASALAKQFKYTSDYIGQLCRAKKVDARLVGRTWFVNPQSVTEHRQGKYKKTDNESSFEIAINKTDPASKIKPVRIDVKPPLKNKTAKQAFSESTKPTTRRVSISYEDDTESLIPDITGKMRVLETERNLPQPKYLRVEPASAKKIRISTIAKKSSNFAPEELPDFALSGKLPVMGMEEPSASIESEPEPEPEKVTEVNKPKFSGGLITMKKPSTHRRFQVQRKETTLSTTPVAVPKKPTAAKVAVPQPLPLRHPSLLVRLSPLLTTFLAVVVAVVIFSAGSTLEVSADQLTSKISIQLVNFLDLVQR